MLTLLVAGVSSLAAAEEKAPAKPAPAASDAVVMDRVTQDEFKKLLEADKVLVVDVRGADAYKAGHIPGAVSAPLTELEKHLPALKAAKKPIVTYCA